MFKTFVSLVYEHTSYLFLTMQSHSGETLHHFLFTIYVGPLTRVLET